MARDNTAAPAAQSIPAFPVPYPSHMPVDAVDDALAMMQVVFELMSDDRAFGPGFSRQISIVLWGAIEKLQPVSIFLNSDQSDRSDRYLDARREWIRQHGGCS